MNLTPIHKPMTYHTIFTKCKPQSKIKARKYIVTCIQKFSKTSIMLEVLPIIHEHVEGVWISET